MKHRTEKIKRLWAIANKLYGRQKEKSIYDMIHFVYEKERIRELTDEELNDVLNHLIKMLSEEECPQAPGEYRVIKALQRKLGWDDSYLNNFIRKVTGVSHIRFLDYYSARATISALRKLEKKYAKTV